MLQLFVCLTSISPDACTAPILPSSNLVPTTGSDNDLDFMISPMYYQHLCKLAKLTDPKWVPPHCWQNKKAFYLRSHNMIDYTSNENLQYHIFLLVVICRLIFFISFIAANVIHMCSIMDGCCWESTDLC